MIEVVYALWRRDMKKFLRSRLYRQIRRAVSLGERRHIDPRILRSVFAECASAR